MLGQAHKIQEQPMDKNTIKTRGDQTHKIGGRHRQQEPLTTGSLGLTLTQQLEPGRQATAQKPLAGRHSK